MKDLVLLFCMLKRISSQIRKLIREDETQLSIFASNIAVSPSQTQASVGIKSCHAIFAHRSNLNIDSKVHAANNIVVRLDSAPNSAKGTRRLLASTASSRCAGAAPLDGGRADSGNVALAKQVL